MVVCSTGFKDFDLLHLSKVVKLMGNCSMPFYKAKANIWQAALTTNISSRQRVFSFADLLAPTSRSYSLQRNMAYPPFR